MATTDEPTQALLPGRRSFLVRLTAQAGMRAAMLEIVNNYIDGLAEEPGTELFVVSLDAENADIVWLYEMFKDEEAAEAHRASSGFARMMQAMPDLLASPPALLPMEPIRMSVQEGVLAEDWTF